MYQDRREAGEILAGELACRKFSSVIILAVPRGGIAVAAPIAERLDAELGILVTRKIGHPSNPEFAIGAVMADGSAILDDQLIKSAGIPENVIEGIIAREFEELKRRMAAYSEFTKPLSLAARTAVIIDDGIATGYTVRAAICWLKALSPAKIVVAVPVAPPETVKTLSREADDIICPLQPEYFMAVGQYYRNFPQITDMEALAIIRGMKNDFAELKQE